jgi:calnexin
MTDGLMFDNILITHDKAVADDFAEKTWVEKSKVEREKQAEEERKQQELMKNVSAFDQIHLCSSL